MFPLEFHHKIGHVVTWGTLEQKQQSERRQINGNKSYYDGVGFRGRAWGGRLCDFTDFVQALVVVFHVKVSRGTGGGRGRTVILLTFSIHLSKQSFFLVN